MARPIRINRMPCRTGRNRPRTPKTMKNQPIISNPILLIAPNDRLPQNGSGLNRVLISKSSETLPLLKEVLWTPWKRIPIITLKIDVFQ
jgi:hypothetical protein